MWWNMGMLKSFVFFPSLQEEESRSHLAVSLPLVHSHLQVSQILLSHPFFSFSPSVTQDIHQTVSSMDFRERCWSQHNSHFFELIVPPPPRTTIRGLVKINAFCQYRNIFSPFLFWILWFKKQFYWIWTFSHHDHFLLHT
jgi:hypothetical protein